MTNYLQMTNKDITTKEILDKVLNKEITNNKAGELLGLGKRQIIRKKKEYKEKGIKGLIHKSRGKTSNHKHDPTKYEEIIKLRKEKYYDYNIIHFQEKLEENHSIKISYGTLRNELINNGLFKSKKHKFKPQREKRERKANEGELEQYDGSYHFWLEDRNGGKELCLLLAIDDATGKAYAKFDKNEGINATFNFWKEYIQENGKPRGIYLDKFATYKINHPNATNDKELPTQFGRVCQTLGIQLIFANSPQGKGRVEKANYTFQDRLVKELREANICDIDNANKFLKDIFLPKYNNKFNVQPREKANVHIKLSKNELEHLNQIFSKQSKRKLKNDFTIAFNNNYYQLYRNKDGGGPILYKGDIITVEEHLDGKIYLSKNGKYLTFKKLEEKRKRRYLLPMAPANNLHFIEMKNEIEKLEEIIKIKKENELQNKKNIKSYFEIHKKPHPWMKGFNLGKK